MQNTLKKLSIIVFNLISIPLIVLHAIKGKKLIWAHQFGLKDIIALVITDIILLYVLLNWNTITEDKYKTGEWILNANAQEQQLSFGDKLLKSLSLQPIWQILDLDKLYDAVANHESHYCATEWHSKANNCVSIMTWINGKRELKQYKSIADNRADFKRIWKKGYHNVFPTMKEAVRYSGNDNAIAWLKNVTYYYFN